MRLRTLILSCSALLALLYPLVMWQKKLIFSLFPPLKGIASWFWIAEPVFLALVLLASSTGIRQKIICYLCIILAACCLAFAAAEMHFKPPSVQVASREYDSENSIHVKSGQTAHLYEKDDALPDPLLGYGPNTKAQKVAARRVNGDNVIYDVLYSRDEEGRRITPDRGDKADTAILLFGCSFTLGMGVNDQETFAWQLGKILGEKFQVFNYGFMGYGAQQMLALIESGRLDACVQRYKKSYAFFLTIADHPRRCLGPGPFYQGPVYILENGAAKYAGRPKHILDSFFAHSLAYTHFKRAYHRRILAERAQNTHVAIIAKAMHEMDARYHAPFLTLIWPDYIHAEPMLREKGVRTLPLTGAMPDYASAPGKYVIRGDGHPNALAHTRIAEALSAYILQNVQARGKQP